MTKTHIYFYKLYDFDYVKIGKSKYPESRVNGFKTGCPFDGRIVYSTNLLFNTDKIEIVIHKLYADRLIRGEWFKMNDNIIELAKKDLALCDIIIKSSKNMSYDDIVKTVKEEKMAIMRGQNNG